MRVYCTSQYCEFIPNLTSFGPQWFIVPFLSKNVSSLCKTLGIIGNVSPSRITIKKSSFIKKWNSAQDEVQYIVGDPTCDIAIFSCFFTWFLFAFLPGIRIWSLSWICSIDNNLYFVDFAYGRHFPDLIIASCREYY